MSGNEELLPEQTEGFKVGEKKTIDEYHKMGMLFIDFILLLIMVHFSMYCL
jgi:hypothetical protein